VRRTQPEGSLPARHTRVGDSHRPVEACHRQEDTRVEDNHSQAEDSHTLGSVAALREEPTRYGLCVVIETEIDCIYAGVIVSDAVLARLKRLSPSSSLPSQSVAVASSSS